jgi:hypothetical protein
MALSCGPLLENDLPPDELKNYLMTPVDVCRYIDELAFRQIVHAAQVDREWLQD